MAIDLARQLVARWHSPQPDHVALLAAAGVKAVVLDQPDDAFSKAAAARGIETAPASALANVPTEGLWPGIRNGDERRRRDEDVASASREPWVDANGFRIACERALNSQRPAVLAYRFEEKDRMVPFETLECGLIEARTAGGNYVLDVEPRYRAALLAGDAKAKEAWASLGQTAAWLEKNAELFGRPTVPAITVLVERGFSMDEIANLLYRRNGSPAIRSAAAPPKPDPARIQVLVAATLKSIPPAVWDHAAAGATVVTDAKPLASWKLTKKEEDRSAYALGKGQVIAYHSQVVDPSEFALDVIDILNHRRRAARIWNANSAIAVATEGTRAGEGLLHLVNYGRPVEEVQGRIQGHFSSAVVLRPETKDTDLKVYRRGAASEVFVPGLTRVATVRFRA